MTSKTPTPRPVSLTEDAKTSDPTPKPILSLDEAAKDRVEKTVKLTGKVVAKAAKGEGIRLGRAVVNDVTTAVLQGRDPFRGLMDTIYFALRYEGVSPVMLEEARVMMGLAAAKVTVSDQSV